MNVDQFYICAEAGYIHSCGKRVYTSKMKEVNGEELFDTIKQFVGKPIKKKNVAVYAHEDFTPHDRHLKSELKGGLDDVKVYVEKYYIGGKPFVRFLDDLQKKLRKRIIIQEAGPYKDTRKKIMEDPTVNRESTLWMIIDKPFGRLRKPEEDRFLICYDQVYKNYNPFYYFDENKPAWVTHTTIPHTLAAALINIIRPTLSETPSIADPFSGTGTILLEALKINNLKLYCSDHDPIYPIVFDDNWDFFTNSETVNKLFIFLEKIKPKLNHLDSKTSDYFLKHKKDPMVVSFKKVSNFFKKNYTKQEKEEYFSQDEFNTLKEWHFNERVLLYLFFRTYKRHHGALTRGSATLSALIPELETLMGQISELQKLRNMMNNSGKEVPSKGRGMFIDFMGTYSRGCSIQTETLKQRYKQVMGWKGIKTLDACVKRKIKFDAIITDPPYGFNTQEHTEKLATTYTLAIREMISSLNDGGHLVLCLPEVSYTGRKIPHYCRKGWITGQILSEAENLGFEAVSGAKILPSPGNCFRPPYYWESEKALERAIVHFRFRKKTQLGMTSPLKLISLKRP